ncbi:MAG: acetyl-CoA C-acyltransferase [Acidimicrobiia bacterium]|nr:acetyl-CoA C-acyltransferase [Acidimicrobiia bacterium]MDH5288967.1 acetyl-CoA C-acyltransferase [Acidimicrobiia bacterium]
MQDAVIVATARTPIGRAVKGSLKDERADDLVGFIIADLLSKVPQLEPAEIDDVVVGVANATGQQSRNLGRLAGQLAGLPQSVPGTTVQRACASSLQAIRVAAHAVRAGEGDVFVAGGVECVSQFYEPQDPGNPRFMDPERADYLDDFYIPMGMTAENVAEKYDVSRQRMDEFAKLSQDRAVAAQANGFFEREITPYTRADGSVVATDDGPRDGTTLEGLAKLKAAFKPDGRVTAGNACPLNDGAAAVLVMSATRAEALGLTPLARVVASAVSGLDPKIMGVGPIEAVTKLLNRTGMKIGDIDVFELNEAFAAQVLPICDELGVSIEDQLNPHGGAIALGHPFGMTGARIMTTLINDLQTLDRTYGIETMCVGGGQGMAMLIERLS